MIVSRETCEAVNLSCTKATDLLNIAFLNGGAYYGARLEDIALSSQNTIVECPYVVAT